MPTRKSPPAVCSRTGVTIPECSCGVCLEEQIRRHSPALLERNAGETVTPYPARLAPPADEVPNRRAA